MEEECATLRDDVSHTTMGKDELIKKAWEVRDAAVKRKNNTEIELARSRIDVMQVSLAFYLWNTGFVAGLESPTRPLINIWKFLPSLFYLGNSH